MSSYKRVCKRCLEFKWTKARGLCETCWKEARVTKFEHYPLKSELPVGLVCQCFSPIREPIPVFDVVQCKRCGKKVL